MGNLCILVFQKLKLNGIGIRKEGSVAFLELFVNKASYYTDFNSLFLYIETICFVRLNVQIRINTTKIYIWKTIFSQTKRFDIEKQAVRHLDFLIAYMKNVEKTTLVSLLLNA